MFSYLFQSIPRIIFEPLAVVVLLWGLLSLFFLRKKDRLLFWFVTTAILFMLTWRIACHAVMYSRRYSSFLIYPTIIFCALFCVKLVPFLRLILKKCKLDSLLLRRLAFAFGIVVIIGLNVGSLIKITKFNRYTEFVPKICQEYLKHCKTQGELYVDEDECNRVAWYTNKKTEEIGRIRNIKAEGRFSGAKKCIEKLQNYPGEHYLILFHDRGLGEPTLKNMKLSSEYGSLNIIARQYTSKRKSKELLLVHFKPGCPNIEEWKGAIPELPVNNLCKNGDFETPLADTYVKNMQKRYDDFGIGKIYDLSVRKVPNLWWLSLGRWNSSNPPDMRLVTERPLAGKSSFFMDGSSPRQIAAANTWYFLENKRIKYSLFVRAESGKPVDFSIGVVSRNIKRSHFPVTYTKSFKLQPEKLYHIYGSIPIGTFPADLQNCSFMMRTNGAVTVDQVSMIPY